jgi:methionyl-tRNA formyltransferase
MIPLWKGKNPIYFRVIRSKLKVTVTINRNFDNRVVSQDNFSSVYWIFNKLGHMIPLWKGKNPIYFGVIRSKVKVTVTINIIFDNRVIPVQ